MIDCWLNDVLWGGDGRGSMYLFIMVSLGTWEGYCNASITLSLEVLGDPLKNSGATDCCKKQFSRGFWTLYGPNTPLKR